MFSDTSGKSISGIKTAPLTKTGGSDRRPTFESRSAGGVGGNQMGIKCFLLLMAGCGLSVCSHAWENLPRKPFGQANLLPDSGQWLVSPFYSYTRWLYFFADDGGKHEIPQTL